MDLLSPKTDNLCLLIVGLSVDSIEHRCENIHWISGLKEFQVAFVCLTKIGPQCNKL